MNLSRRSFLGAASAAAVAATLPFPKAAATKTLVVEGAGAIKEGDVFTIAGVYKRGSPRLQQFRVVHATSSAIEVADA